MDNLIPFDRAISPTEFDILCLTHRLEMRTPRLPRQGTIRWTYSATRVGSSEPARARRLRHDHAAEVFLDLARGAEAERLAIVESERAARARRSGLALAFGLAMASLAFGGVLTAWTDVSAAPGLRSGEGALSIADVDPADEVVPLLPDLPTGALVPKVIDAEPLTLDDPGPVISEDSYDFVGPVGRDGTDERDLAQAPERTAPAARRISRARPLDVARRAQSPSRTQEASSTEEEEVVEVDDMDERPLRGSMSFGRDELASPLPTTLTRGQVNAGIRGISRMVRNCARGEPDRTVRVDLTIDGSSGRVVIARVRGYHQNTTAGTCVTRALRRAQFPTFANAHLSLRAYPLVLR